MAKYTLSMNKIWVIALLIATVWLTVEAPESVLSVYLSGTSAALEFTLKMAVIYALWLGINALMEKSGINKIIAKLFRPVTRRLFPNEKPETHEYISLNFSANLLGMGGVATPLGIKAIESMNTGSDTASQSMRLFTVINCTSLQLIPATVIAMRATAGSANAADIVLPTLLATSVATIVGVVLVKIIK